MTIVLFGTEENMKEAIRLALNALHFSMTGYSEQQMTNDHKEEVISVTTNENVACKMQPAMHN